MPKISKQEARARYGLSERTLDRYAAEGRLTAYRIGARFIRFDTADLDALTQPISADSNPAA